MTQTNKKETSYEKYALSTDLLIFSVSKGEAKTCRTLSDKYFSILLVKRTKEPYKGKWCLPGGFVKKEETLDMAADRVLAKETNLHNIYKEQLFTFSDLERDPRTRVISTAYMALIDKERIVDELSEEASWFNIHIVENKELVDVILENEKEEIKFTIKKLVEDKTTNKPNEIYFTGRSSITQGVRTIYADKIRMTVNPKDFEATGNTRTVIRNLGSGGDDSGMSLGL